MESLNGGFTVPRLTCKDFGLSKDPGRVRVLTQIRVPRPPCTCGVQTSETQTFPTPEKSSYSPYSTTGDLSDSTTSHTRCLLVYFPPGLSPTLVSETEHISTKIERGFPVFYLSLLDSSRRGRHWNPFHERGSSGGGWFLLEVFPCRTAPTPTVESRHRLLESGRRVRQVSRDNCSATKRRSRLHPETSTPLSSVRAECSDSQISLESRSDSGNVSHRYTGVNGPC